MKIRILFATLLLCVFALNPGCSQKPDPRIAALENQFKEMTNQMHWLELREDTFEQTIKDYDVANISSLTNMSAMLEAETRMFADQNERYDHIEYLLTNLPAKNVARLQPAPVVATQVQYKNGVPLAVYNQIYADAVKEWPGDYNMQAYTINRQIESYKKLHP